MLSFPTRTISAGAVQVNGTLGPEDAVWLEGDQRPLGLGVSVTGRLSSAGPGRFYFSGTLRGTMSQECRRCLGEVEVPITAEVKRLFAEGAVADEDDDPDVFRLVQGRGGAAVDLRPAVREAWLLETPALVVCRPECLGLCPKCCANLNQGACSCAP